MTDKKANQYGASELSEGQHEITGSPEVQHDESRSSGQHGTTGSSEVQHEESMIIRRPT